jgi:hypothetical protein
MCSRDRLQDIRAFEFFLFGGIPEAAESMFERDTHHHFGVRKTRRGVTEEPVVDDSDECISVIEVDPETGAVFIKRHHEPSDTSS